MKGWWNDTMQFNLHLQLHGGKGGSTTNVQSYTPTDEERRLQQQAADYSEAVAPNALRLNNVANGLLLNSLGETQVDFAGLNNSAQSQISSAQNGVSGLINGELPSAYQENMENSIKKGVNNSMGTLLTDLGNRGILNSSVTSKGIQGINDSASDAMANAYNSNIGLLSQLYGQQTSGATAGITAGAAAQEAAQQPALNLWNASLGLNGATTGALSALAGQGTTTATQSTSGGSGLLGGVLGSLAGGIGSTYGTTWCFPEETKVKTPSGDKEIKRITVGQEVISPSVTGEDKTEKVTEVMIPHYSDVYNVVTKDKENNKHYVSATLSQPLLQEDGSFITVDKIDVGRTKLKYGNETVNVISIIYSGERKVFDLTVSGNNMYYADGFIAQGGTAKVWGEE